MDDDSKVTTVRLPRSIWSKVKHLQGDDKVKSIQDAVVRGLELLFKTLDRQTERDEDGK